MANFTTRTRRLSELLWGRYPIRECRRFPVAACELCHQTILVGESYYDGGPTRRGHKHCVERRLLHQQGQTG